MKHTVECPLCTADELASMEMQKRTVKYKGAEYQVTAYYYRCDSCKEEFTTDELDQLTLSQIPNSIWSKIQ